ncbi:MAG: cation:proton antiporter, partial [Salinisphaeraceae bacterium]|nr:cation:proton antiporter [Salinisphaeraceae bacterium]
PILFTGFGYLLGEAGGDILDMRIDGTVLHHFAEFTLVLVLFTDAASVRIKQLQHNFFLPARMLLLGIPLTLLLGYAVAQWVSPQAPWAVALLVAAILTPTDAALGQTFVSSPKVPTKLREAISVESGLNDGLAVPIVIVAAILSAKATGTSFHAAPDNLSQFIAMQLVFGPLVGIALGYALARLLDRGIAADYVSDTGRAIAVLAGALLCFAFAELIGGNGFIAAFVGGLVLGNSLKADKDFIVEFMASEGQILTMLTFIIFGAILMPIGLEHASWRTLVLAIAFLTIVRMLPVWFALAGTGLRASHKLCLGWFGPRGLASVLFALLIDEQFNIPGFEEVLACVVLTVLLSILLHGVSATPVARWLGDQPGGDQKQ